MLKTAVVLFAIVAVLLAGMFLQYAPRAQKPFAFLLGFLPYTYLHTTSLHLLWDNDYRGADTSFEFTSIDLISWMMFFAVGRQPHSMPFRAAQLPYLAIAVASLAWAAVPLYTAFSVWQIIKMMLFVAGISRTLQRTDLFEAFLHGLAGGLLWEAASCWKGRYVYGSFQVEGTFDHQNSMAMAVNIITPLMLVLFMRERNRLFMAAIAAGVFAVVLSLSRGSLAMLVLGLGIAYLAMMMRGINRRKLAISLLGFVGVVAVLIASLDSIIARFESAPEASGESRDQYITAARAMLQDTDGYGVGLNQYPHWLSAKYATQLNLYYVDSGVAHHIYWLNLAELGYIGLVAYLLMIGVPMLNALRTARVARGTREGDIAIGCAAGMISMHTQGTLEWVARQTEQLYLFWSVSVLCIVAYWRHKDAQRKAPAAKVWTQQKATPWRHPPPG